MSTLPVEVALREQIEIMERQVADLKRQNRALSEAVDALMQPASIRIVGEEHSGTRRRQTDEALHFLPIFTAIARRYKSVAKAVKDGSLNFVHAVRGVRCL